MEDSRKRAKQTLLEKDPEFFSKLAAMPHKRGFNNPETLKKALETRKRKQDEISSETE